VVQPGIVPGSKAVARHTTGQAQPADERRAGGPEPVEEETPTWHRCIRLLLIAGAPRRPAPRHNNQNEHVERKTNEVLP
jgi:hypothetical protein